MIDNFPKIKLGNVKIFAGSKISFFEINKKVLFSKESESLVISSTSVHGIIEAQDDKKYEDILNQSFLLNPDGKPLSLLGRILGEQDIEQIRGPDVLPEICNITANSNLKHFFYGGKEGVADKLAVSLINNNPELSVSGTFCPPFRELSTKEMDDIAKIINETKTDIVWVGLSTPKQEKWASEIRKRIKVKAIYTVGAAFDFEIGLVKPAPSWIAKIYLEWLYRILKEPRRLLARYLKIIPKFVYISINEILKNKFS